MEGCEATLLSVAHVHMYYISKDHGTNQHFAVGCVNVQCKVFSFYRQNSQAILVQKPDLELDAPLYTGVSASSYLRIQPASHANRVQLTPNTRIGCQILWCLCTGDMQSGYQHTHVLR